MPQLYVETSIVSYLRQRPSALDMKTSQYGPISVHVPPASRTFGTPEPKTCESQEIVGGVW